MRLWRPRLLMMGLFGQLLMAEIALSVDQTEIRIEGRWSVVGVIAGDRSKSAAPTGIAVLRSSVTKRTYTLSIGDSVPNEFGFVLKHVLPRSVVIAKNDESVTLNFAEPTTEPAEAAPDLPARSSRFLDQYYRSFNRARSEPRVLDDDDDQALYLPEASGLPRVTSKHDEATLPTSRGRTYRMEEDGDGFIVNYDDLDGQLDD